jgi:hypothetical protein
VFTEIKPRGEIKEKKLDGSCCWRKSLL